MRQTSDTYRRIISGDNYEFDSRLTIGEKGVLITQHGDTISFGGDHIMVDDQSPNGGYGESLLIDMSVTRKTFANGVPEVGCCIAGEIHVQMANPSGTIPRRGRMVPYVRVSNEEEHSEWLKKGVYYVDTRELTANDDGLVILTLHGYDAMLFAEQDYANSTLAWPAKDANVLREIAQTMGVGIDSRVWETIPTAGRYNIQLPSDYTLRETLGYIGAMYAGNWVMNDDGDLRLIKLNELPTETNLLLDHAGYQLVFGSEDGEVRIRV